jgi:hypothetical protein
MKSVAVETIDIMTLQLVRSTMTPLEPTKEANLAISGGKRPVSKASSIRVAEGQCRCNDIGNQNKVPLHLGKYGRDGSCRDCNERNIVGCDKP